MIILPNGSVEIKNKSTGETKIVDPSELPNYGVPYSKYQTELEAAQKIGIEGAGKTTDAKQQQKTDSIQGVLDNLSSLYFGKEGEKSLALTKEGGFRLPAQLKELQSKYVAGKANSIEKRIYEFNRLKQSKMAFFAKAYGDTGNIAYQEQLNAIKSLPDIATAPGEALTLWDTAYSSTRAKPSKRLESEFKKSNYQRQEDIAAGKTQPTGIPTSTPTITPPPNIPPTGGGNSNPPDLMSLLKGGASVAGETVARTAGANPVLLKLLENPTIQNLIAMGNPRKADVVNTIKQGQVPSADQALGAGGELALGAATAGVGGLPAWLSLLGGGAIHGATTPGASGEERKNAAVFEGALGGLLGAGGSLLNRGKNIVTGKDYGKAVQARSSVAEQTKKTIDNEMLNPVIQEGDRIATKYSEIAPLWEKIKPGITKNTTVPDLVETIDYWGKAFKASGALKDTPGGKLFGNLQRKVKDVLGESAPDVLKAHEKLQKEASLKAALPNALKKTLFYGGAATGLAGGGAYLFNLLKGNR